MTVASSTSRADYNGNGATTLFVVPFHFLLATDIQVILTDDGTAPVTVTTLALNTDYTVAGAANPAGGSITCTVAPTSTQRISILRSVPYTQLKHYVPNDPFPAASHEQALDKLTMEIQQLAEAQSRALTLAPNSDSGASVVLPEPEANNLLGWNQTETALQNVDPTTLATIVAFGTANSDVFSGNGVQTAFALSANPGALNNLDVAISGVTQRPGLDYNWTSGTTLTFTVAPPAGTNNVLARYMQALPAEDSALRIDLANSGIAVLGDALVAVKRVDIPGALAVTQHDWNERARVNVRQMGVAGDGVTDDAPLLNALGALGIPLFIPYTATGYRIGSTVTFACDVFCEGSLIPDAAIGAAALDINRFAVVLPSAGYGQRRRYHGIRVNGSVALRTAGVCGIRNDCENSHMNLCQAWQLARGIVIRNYSITLDKCGAWQCSESNLSAYARSVSTEINALTILGGAYDSPAGVGYSIIIGDTSFSDSLAAGNSHGFVITVSGGVSIDGGSLWIANVSCVHIRNLYSETATTQKSVIVGDSRNPFSLAGALLDRNVRNFDIDNSFFNNVDYAVYCVTAVDGLEVGRNFYTQVRRSALYLVSDIFSYSYLQGDATSSFTQGQEVHTGFRSLVTSSLSFQSATIPSHGLFRGVQTVSADIGIYYAGGMLKTSTTQSTNAASAVGRFYLPARTAKAGTVASNVFTFTTLADCYAFNGGDRITTAPAGAAYVRSVDYASGTMVMDGGVTANGAATVLQDAAILSSQTITFSGSAPTAGAWNRGDRATNGVAAVGQPKGWLCTVSGTPGTWVSEGNL